MTAVDVSPTALAHVRADAALGSRIRTEPHDLSASFPHDRFDLDSAQYLHWPIAFPR